MTSEATWAGPSPSLTILLSPIQLLSPLPYAAFLNIQYLPQISPLLLPILFSVDGFAFCFSKKETSLHSNPFTFSNPCLFHSQALITTLAPVQVPSSPTASEILLLTPSPLIYSTRTLYWLFSFNITSMLKSVPVFKCKQTKTSSVNHTFH